jgi:hypothetical protein
VNSSRQYGPYEGQDKVKWCAVILSPWTETVYAFYDLFEWNTSKDDTGDSGQFSLTMPYTNPYSITGQPSPLVKDYASIMGPMDLVAIYAYRDRDDNPSTVPLGPLGSTLTDLNLNLTYADIETIGALGSATCVMIGVVDSAVEVVASMSEHPDAHISLSGRDLTKILDMNDANVPAVSTAGESGYFATPITLANTGAASGTQLVTKMLDLVVSKDVNAASSADAQIPSGAEASFLQYGFAWRSWIRTDALIPGFTNLLGGQFPNIQVQNGSGWANVQEIRNAPAFRLFVNEIGQLIFDNAVTAWTTKPAVGQLTAADIYHFEVSISDANLITFLVVYPQGALAAQTSIVAMKGYSASLGFAGGVTGGGEGGVNPALTGTDIVETYGYRYGEFSAFYAVTIADANVLFPAIQLYHNSLFRGHLVIRGTTAWRVGDRILVPVTTAKGATTNQIWYIERIEHQATYGEEWRTSLSLRFPGGK